MKFRNFAVVLGLLLLVFSSLSVLEPSVASSKTQSTSNKIVDDQVVEYNVAVRAGTKTDRCVQAGFVASAYNQAKDAPNYEEWVRIRRSDCQAAGLPQ